MGCLLHSITLFTRGQYRDINNRNAGYDGLKLEQTTSFPVQRRVTFLRGLAAEFNQPAGADRQHSELTRWPTRLREY